MVYEITYLFGLFIVFLIVNSIPEWVIHNTSISLNTVANIVLRTSAGPNNFRLLINDLIFVRHLYNVLTMQQ
jgi:hypothetical protein